MSATPRDDPGTAAEPGEGLQGFMSNDDWERLLAFVSDRIQAFEQLEDLQTREQIFELLQGIDAIHREGLTRLVRLFKEGVLEQVITDPPIHTLMELYDLLPPEAAGNPAAASDEGVAGGTCAERIPIRVVSESSGDSGEAAPPPHWIPVLQSVDSIPDGGVRLVSADERELLLCRVGDRVYALDPRCPRDRSSLQRASLERYTLNCPHHEGCFYDVRSGTRVGGGRALSGYPVRRDDGRILVGIGIPFKPRLPAF